MKITDGNLSVEVTLSNLFKITIDEAIVGHITIMRKNGKAQLSCIIFPQYVSMGYGTKSVKLFTDWFLLTNKSVYAVINEHNTASIRVFEKAGYVIADANYESINTLKGISKKYLYVKHQKNN